MSKDIQQNIDLEKELHQANKILQEYKKAVDESTIFSIGDLKGNITYANKQFRNISGYTLKELIGKPHSIVRDPNTPKEAFEDMWQTIQNKKVWKGSLSNRKKNGDIYYVEATIVPILGDNNEIVEYAGIRSDITLLVTKERELLALRDKQRYEDVDKALKITNSNILDAVPFAAILVCEKTHMIIESNECFESMFFDYSFLEDKPKIDKLLLNEADDAVYEDKHLSFTQRYELLAPNSKAYIDINGEIVEFIIGIKKLENAYVVSFATEEFTCKITM
ncbi:MAG: PAS domain-containing protein [Sulfurimonas sp.]|jgi:PAS domain S-box-containing protein|nr:PAS domain-containing protein [Sulfurimonas sp.]